MGAVDATERVAAYRTHIHTVGKDGVDTIAIHCGDFDGDIRSVVHGGVGRSDTAAIARRRRHPIFVEDELGGNRVVAPYIRKRVGAGGIYRFAIHQQTRQVPARSRRKRIGGVIAA